MQNSSCGRAADRTPLSRLQPCMQFWLRYTLSTRWRRRIPLLGQGFDTSKQVAELRRFKPETRIEDLANGSSSSVVSQHSSYRILAKWTSYVRTSSTHRIMMVKSRRLYRTSLERPLYSLSTSQNAANGWSWVDWLCQDGQCFAPHPTLVSFPCPAIGEWAYWGSTTPHFNPTSLYQCRCCQQAARG